MERGCGRGGGRGVGEQPLLGVWTVSMSVQFRMVAIRSENNNNREPTERFPKLKALYNLKSNNIQSTNTHNYTNQWYTIVQNIRKINEHIHTKHGKNTRTQKPICAPPRLSEVSQRCLSVSDSKQMGWRHSRTSDTEVSSCCLEWVSVLVRHMIPSRGNRQHSKHQLYFQQPNSFQN